MNVDDLQKRVSESEPNGLCKVRIDHDGEGEGIWACFCTPKDRETYDGNKAGDTFEAFLMNHALIGGPSWGGRLKVALDGGDSRPQILAADVIRQMNEAIASGDYPSLDWRAYDTL